MFATFSKESFLKYAQVEDILYEVHCHYLRNYPGFLQTHHDAPEANSDEFDEPEKFPGDIRKSDIECLLRAILFIA
jgi:hypothetical protein